MTTSKSNSCSILAHEDGGGGGLERLVGIEEIERGDAGGELAGPERNRRIFGINEASGGDVAVACDDDIVLMEGENGRGVSEGELVQSLDHGDERLREHNHLGIIDGAKDFLELHH